MDRTFLSSNLKRSQQRFPYLLSAVGDPRRATHIPARVIEYTVTGTNASRGPEVFRLITTILDPEDVTAAELAAAYQQRWEYEIALKEIETQMLEPGGGLVEVPRTRPPGAVGPVAGALRHTLADVRGCRVRRA